MRIPLMEALAARVPVPDGFERFDPAAFVRACTAPFDPDDPGNFDPAMVRQVVPVVDAFCRAWYRLEIDGFDNVPDGPALVVVNHNAGITFLEILGLGARWYLVRGLGDPLHGLGHDAMFRVPGVGGFLARGGGVRANHGNADRVFAMGRKAIVAPGGNLEAFRSFAERGRIKFGGRKGFLRLALRHGVPLVPVVLHGGHESFVVLHDGAPLARALHVDRLLRSDTWPLMLALPWGVALGPVFHLPLPVKVRGRFLAPIPTAGYGPGAADDPAVLDELYGRVTGVMQNAMDDLDAGRRTFLG